MNEKTRFNIYKRSCGPISGVHVYPNGTCVVRRVGSAKPPVAEATRGQIESLSRKSLNRLAFVVNETQVVFRSMYTLSYGLDWPMDGKRVKEHLNQWLITAKRRGVTKDYLWFLEFQRRGAPHIHVLLDRPKTTVEAHMVMAMEWALIATDRQYTSYSDIVSRETLCHRTRIYKVHRHRLQWQNERKPGGLSRYALKYALKPEQKVVPKNYQDVGRFWGYSRGVKRAIPEPRDLEMNESELRLALDALEHRTAGWDIVPKYIFGL